MSKYILLQISMGGTVIYSGGYDTLEGAQTQRAQLGGNGIVLVGAES